MTVQHLAGVITFSPDPERLATFYRGALGIPFEKQQHGQIREHLECEIGDVHFAILKKAQTYPGSNIAPSFLVADIEDFLMQLNQSGVKPLHPVIDIGDGKRVSSIVDPDGNMIRLIQID